MQISIMGEARVTGPDGAEGAPEVMEPHPFNFSQLADAEPGLAEVHEVGKSPRRLE